jgi:hypothetical protein
VVSATPWSLYPGKETRSWVGPTGGLDGHGRSQLHRDSIPGSSSVKYVRLVFPPVEHMIRNERACVTVCDALNVYLDEGFRRFSTVFPVEAPRLGHNRFLPYPFQYGVHSCIRQRHKIIVPVRRVSLPFRKRCICHLSQCMFSSYNCLL